MGKDFKNSKSNVYNEVSLYHKQLECNGKNNESER